MGVNAAKNFMIQAPFHSTFPILVITKIFENSELNESVFDLFNHFQDSS